MENGLGKKLYWKKYIISEKDLKEALENEVNKLITFSNGLFHIQAFIVETIVA